MFYGSRPFKRFYNLQKVQKASIVPFGINASGWINTSVLAATAVDIGAHILGLTHIGYSNGDYLGKIEVTWYIKFKSRRPV